MSPDAWIAAGIFSLIPMTLTGCLIYADRWAQKQLRERGIIK